MQTESLTEVFGRLQEKLVRSYSLKVGEYNVKDPLDALSSIGLRELEDDSALVLATLILIGIGMEEEYNPYDFVDDLRGHFSQFDEVKGVE